MTKPYYETDGYDEVCKAVNSNDITIDEIKMAVCYINNIRHDDEVAHGTEDKLHSAVLRAIALGNTEPHGVEGDASDLAFAALETTNLDFARYCS